MILDQNLFLGSDQTAAGTAGATSIVGDIIDLGVSGTYPGTDGQTLYAVVQCVTQIITNGVAGTIQFAVRSADSTDLSSTNAIIHAGGTFILTDDATAINVAIAAGQHNALPNQVGGLLLGVKLPHGPYGRYLGITKAPFTADTTGGTVTAFLTHDLSAWRALPDVAND